MNILPPKNRSPLKSLFIYFRVEQYTKVNHSRHTKSLASQQYICQVISSRLYFPNHSTPHFPNHTSPVSDSFDTEKCWDKGIHLLLFASRESVQESLDFSPFELVFGHTVRGPLKLFKEKFLSDSNDCLAFKSM